MTREKSDLWAKENNLNLLVSKLPEVKLVDGVPEVSDDKPVVTKMGFLDMQVCVPSDWTDDQVRAFAEKEYPCGTMNGWHIRGPESQAQLGMPERVKCEGRDGFVHIMLEA